jgi:hypothetical protein
LLRNPCAATQKREPSGFDPAVYLAAKSFRRHLLAVEKFVFVGRGSRMSVVASKVVQMLDSYRHRTPDEVFPYLSGVDHSSYQCRT